MEQRIVVPFPACFDSQFAYDAWAALAEESIPFPYLPTDRQHCHDCTPAFYAKSRAADRCPYSEMAWVGMPEEPGDEAGSYGADPSLYPTLGHAVMVYSG